MHLHMYTCMHAQYTRVHCSSMFPILESDPVRKEKKLGLETELQSQGPLQTNQGGSETIVYHHG